MIAHVRFISFQSFQFYEKVFSHFALQLFVTSQNSSLYERDQSPHKTNFETLDLKLKYSQFE